MNKSILRWTSSEHLSQPELTVSRNWVCDYEFIRQKVLLKLPFIQFEPHGVGGACRSHYRYAENHIVTLQCNLCSISRCIESILLSLSPPTVTENWPVVAPHQVDDRSMHGSITGEPPVAAY